jgi:hypothetical protein
MMSGRSEWMNPSFLFYPLFLTSALPIFAAMQPEDDLKASREMRPRSTG